MKNKVCMISTVHNAEDVRIFHKEAKSLKKAGYHICLIARYPQNSLVEGIEIRALPEVHSKIRRMVMAPFRALAMAVNVRASIYHFHDPELLFIGYLLKIFTKSAVIYDAHEDFPATVFARDWIPEWLQPVLSRMVDFLELTISRKFDAVITADPAVAQRFSRIHKKVTILYNVPLKELIVLQSADSQERERSLVHIGSLSRSRGVWFLRDVIDELVSMEVEFQMDFFVNETSRDIKEDFGSQIAEAGLNSYVNMYEAIPYSALLQELRNYRIGLIPFLDMDKYHKNIATKMFDYMASELAIVASDLPPQRLVIGAVECGKLIEPEDPQAFARAIKDLLADSAEVKRMGKNGWLAIQSQFNWEEEEKKLLKLYQDLLE